MALSLHTTAQYVAEADQIEIKVWLQDVDELFYPNRIVSGTAQLYLNSVAVGEQIAFDQGRGIYLFVE